MMKSTSFFLHLSCPNSTPVVRLKSILLVATSLLVIFHSTAGCSPPTTLYPETPNTGPPITAKWKSEIFKCGTSKYGCDAGARSSPGRIVGGEEAEVNEFPWQVSLHYRGEFKCGGSLIDERHILTAAHCLTDAIVSRWTVIMGKHYHSYSATEHKSVTSLVLHPDYISTNRRTDYDVAIMTLSDPVIFNTTVIPIRLASADDDDFNSQTGHLAGWGDLREGGQLSNTLQKVAVPIISNTRCQDWYGSKYDITDRMLCAGYRRGGEDACQGDSGGPLLVRSQSGNDCHFKQVGIVSWGKGCARAKTPTVYTRISKFRSWIDSKTK